jgi:cell division transport system ATP-binding protein
MIQFDNVSKTYALGNTALHDVSFTIEDKEFVFLVGPSGAGKTTILKLILHEYYPTSGTITVDSIKITKKKLPHQEKLRRRIGMVFQDFKTLADKNVIENISLSLAVTGTPKNQIKSAVMSALELVGLPGKEFLFPAQLSAGELQRVAIARAIIGDRDIILADEPTGNLDPKTTWEIMRIFKKLEGKKTFIIATHNTDIVNSMKKRVLVMKEGKLAKDLKKGGYEV